MKRRRLVPISCLKRSARYAHAQIPNSATHFDDCDALAMAQKMESCEAAQGFACLVYPWCSNNFASDQLLAITFTWNYWSCIGFLLRCWVGCELHNGVLFDSRVEPAGALNRQASDSLIRSKRNLKHAIFCLWYEQRKYEQIACDKASIQQLASVRTSSLQSETRAKSQRDSMCCATFEIGYYTVQVVTRVHDGECSYQKKQLS